jgi:hypothetical protein
MSNIAEYKIALINEVAYRLYKATEGWDEIGKDIAHLLWAISNDSLFDMHASTEEFDMLMHKLFPTKHTIWQYIGYGPRSTN